MNTLFRKMILLTLVLVMGMAALPLATVSAAGEHDPALPQGQVSNERLERVWARQLHSYERMGRRLERAEKFIARVQALIDRARADGKDVAGVETALEAFEAALKDAHPIYESARGIVNAHPGFDADGKVTDPVKAQETVQEMRARFKEIRESLDATARALREAIRDYREANPRREPAPTSTNG